jgi:hypothetical protein
LISSLRSHEIKLASDEPQRKSKSVALPSTLKSSKALKAKVAESDAEESSVDDQEDGSDDDVFALLTKKFKKWSRRNKNYSGRGFSSRSSGNKEKKDDSKNCFNCHKPGHFITDCPELSTKVKGKKNTFKNKAKKSLMAIWDDINELTYDESETEEANLALMATYASDNENDSESDTDDLEEVISQMFSTQVTKALKDVMMKYMDKSNELKLFKQKINLINEKVSHIQTNYQESLKTTKVLENGCRSCNKPYDKHEIALQEFVHHNIDRKKIASMIYGGSNCNRRGLGFSASSDK